MPPLTVDEHQASIGIVSHNKVIFFFFFQPLMFFSGSGGVPATLTHNQPFVLREKTKRGHVSNASSLLFLPLSVTRTKASAPDGLTNSRYLFKSAVSSAPLGAFKVNDNSNSSLISGFRATCHHGH